MRVKSEDGLTPRCMAAANGDASILQILDEAAQ